MLVLAVLAVSYASSMRAYLQQRAHIDDLKAQIAQRESNIDELEREKRRWHDPAYVAAQARERFGYLMPGETSYVVLGEDGKPLEAETTLTDPATVDRKRPTAWWSEEWSSVELAGHPPKPQAPPASRIDGTEAVSGRERLDPADLAADRGPARPGAARHPRGRPPLPVRQPRRRDDRAAAAQRHAVPDDLLPHLPARRLADRHARGLRH